MASDKHFFTIGLHLLFLVNIVHSFVLITANVEDVKKLARKFVSDSLADQIAEFIAKVGVNANPDVDLSEENEKNRQKIQISEEIDGKIRSHNKVDKSSQKKKEPVDMPQNYDNFDFFTTTPRAHFDDIGDAKASTTEGATTERHQDKQKSGVVVADYEQKIAHIMDAAKQTRKPKPKPKKKSPTHNTKFTAGIYDDKLDAARNLSPDRLKFSQKNSRISMPKNPYTNSKVVLKSDDDKVHDKSDNFKFAQLLPVTNADKGKLTSRREKSEFDAYDYTKYPQSPFLATSGDVALPNLHNEPLQNVRDVEPKDHTNMDMETDWF